MRTRHQQSPLGPRQRHVAGPSLLHLLVVAEGEPELLQVATVHGEDGRVAPQLEVQGLAALCRVLLDRQVGEQVPSQSGNEHGPELESLRLVDGHDLHRVLGGRLDGGPFLLVPRLHGLDVVEERPQRQLAFQGREGMDLVEERSQVPLGGKGPFGVGAGLDLGQQPGSPDDFGQELAHRPTGLDAQLRQLGPELLQPRPSFVGKWMPDPLRDFGNLVEMFEGLGEQERWRVLAVLASQRIVLVLGPCRHPSQVFEPDPISRPQQDPGQAHRSERVRHCAGVRQDLDHLGELEQSRQPHDLGRDPLLGEGLLQRDEQAAGPAQHRELGPQRLRTALVQLLDLPGDPLRLGPLVGERADLDLAFTERRPRLQPLLRVGPFRLRDPLDDPVRSREDPGSRAEVRVEGKPYRRRAVGAAEPLSELEQVEQRCASPAVDALIGVAHGRDREAAPEQPGDEVGLRHVGVLILVQHDGQEPGPVFPPHLGMGLDHPQGKADLIAEVDHAEFSLALLEPCHGPGQLDALEGRLVGALAAMGGQLTEPCLVELDDPPGLDSMVGGLIGQLEDLGHQRGLPLGPDVLERHVVEDPGAQLRALGLGEDPLARLDPRQQAVALQHLGREPVIVGDGGFLALGEIEARQRLAHPEHQVLRGLVGERQAQDVPGKHAGVVGGHAVHSHECQIHDPCRDHRGLTRPGSRHDDVGLERHGDGPPLLGRGRGPHRLDDLLGEGPAHPSTPAEGNSSPPSGNRGHSGLNSQKRQLACGLGR